MLCVEKEFNSPEVKARVSCAGGPVIKSWASRKHAKLQVGRHHFNNTTFMQQLFCLALCLGGGFPLIRTNFGNSKCNERFSLVRT